MKPEDIRILSDSEAITYGEVPPTFRLRRAKEIESTAITRSHFKHQLVLQSKDGKLVIIEGEIDILRFLKESLEEMRDLSWSEIEKLKLPKSSKVLDQYIKRITKDVKKALKKISYLKKRIDVKVCRLYGIDKSDVDSAVSI